MRLGGPFSGLFARHDGFEFKSQTELLLDVRADVFGDAQNVLTRGAPEVHENEGVALVDAHRAALGSLPARGLDEPGGGELAPSPSERIGGNPGVFRKDVVCLLYTSPSPRD